MERRQAAGDTRQVIHHHLRALVTIGVLAVCALALNRSAGAQGFRMGLASALPGPVSSLDLARYGSMMNLTPEQMRAWSEMHERYKSEFKALGEGGGVIAAFIEARKVADGVPFKAQPPRADVERWLSAHQTACAAIKGLDDRLFDELTPLLTREQQLLLQRAKLARERLRISSDELVHEWLDPSAEANLIEIFPSSGAQAGIGDPAISAAVWAALDSYQSDFVAALRQLQEQARGVHREWIKSLTEQGVPPNAIDIRNRDTMDRELFQKVSRAWVDATQKAKPQATRLVRLNRSAAKSVAAMLPAEPARLFRRAVFSAAYGKETLMNLRSQEDDLRRLLKAEGLTDEERSALQAQLVECERQMDAFSEQVADARDAFTANEGPSYSRIPQEARDNAEKVNMAAHEAADNAKRSLRAVISPERMRALFPERRDERVRGMLRQAGVTDALDIEDALAHYARTGSVSIRPPPRLDDAVPDAISHTSMEGLIRSLSLDQDQQAIARQVHAEYLQQYRKQRDEAENAGKGIVIGVMMRPDGRGGMMTAFSPPEDVEKAMALERGSIAVLRHVDRAFFDDLSMALTVKDEALRRARLARDWDTLARGGRNCPEELRTYEAYVPLLTIVDGLDLAPEEMAKADGVILAHGEEFRAAAAAHFDANRAAWFAREFAHAHAGGPVHSPAEIIADKEREATDLKKKAADRRAALATMVRSMVDELATALPDRANALRDGYDRAAYPRVFNDPANAGDLLTKALALKDLTDPQRTELQAASAAFHPKYRDVRKRMIAVNREWDRELPHSNFFQKPREEAKFKWDQSTFERNELNAGVRATLTRVLSPEQRAAIGVSAPATERQ